MSFHDVEVDAQGRVLVTVDNATGVLVARYSDTGSLDTTFGTDGIASASWTNGRSWSLAIQPDGKIVAGGFNSANWLLARFTDAGALDTSFSSDGKQTVSLRSNSQLFNLRLAADGAIVGAGLTSGSNGWDMAVARLTPAGELDTSFNGTGKVMTDVSGYEVVYGLVIGPDYRVSVAGRTGSTIFQRDLVIARYTVAAGLEERLYAQTDANHNVTSVADVYGQVLQRQVYSAYGAVQTLNANWSPIAEGLGFRYFHQGGRYDSITGDYHFRNRDLDPELGRWIQVDPLGYPDGANRYEPLSSSPVASTDSNGLKGSKHAEQKARQGGDLEKDLRRDPAGAPPGAKPKAVVIIGDTECGWTSGMVGYFWRRQAGWYANYFERNGKEVVQYDGASLAQIQQVVADPTVKDIVIIGHGAEEDNLPVVWVNSRELLEPDQLRRWLNGAKLDSFTLRACFQGAPKNAAKWKAALNDSPFRAPEKNDRWWYANPGEK